MLARAVWAAFIGRRMRLPGRFCAVGSSSPIRNATVELRLPGAAAVLREASILARLVHPNLPKVSDSFNQDGRDYLVMDFVPGRFAQVGMRLGARAGAVGEGGVELGRSKSLMR